MLESGSFPDRLKTSLVKPIHKKGSKTDPNNFRPISLLPCFSKLFEKVIYIRIYSFLDKQNVLHKNQFGFRRASSTSLAIYEYLSKLWAGLNDRRDCTGLFLDMSRAFDCVIHSILLRQFEYIGVRGIAKELLQSYLTARNQFVVLSTFDKSSKSIVESRSSLASIQVGVPQGSILGPLMFLVYVNRLPRLTDNLCVMFADDASLLFVNNSGNTSQYEFEINNTVSKIVSWLNSINLKVNLTKTKLIQFGNYKKTRLDLQINFNSTKLEEVCHTDFLGVTIDNHLNWKMHIEKLNNKLSSRCYALSVLVDVASTEVAVSAYYGNIYPLLMYGVLFWGNSVDAAKTFILQKRCLRIIYRMPNDKSLRLVFKRKRLSDCYWNIYLRNMSTCT